MLNLSGKNVVVVVSEFGDIGHELSRLLLQKNINILIILGRMENAAALTQLQTEAGAAKVVNIPVELTEQASIEHAARQIGGLVKHVDVLINGAGILSDGDVQKTIAVNLTGLIQTTLALMPLMDKTQAGHGAVVLNIASVFGLEPAAGLPVYAAGKHGVVGFTRSLADQRIYSKTGVAFIAVCPGLTRGTTLHLRENVILEQHAEQFLQSVEKAKRQPAHEVGAAIIKAVELAKNGALYLATSGQLKEVHPTTHWQLN